LNNTEMSEPVVTKSVHVDTENGLHIRPAEALARLANRFASRIDIVYESQRVDAKSIMEMLTLGAGQGAHLQVEARGDDAQQAIDAIMALVESNFESPNGAAPTQNSSPS
jgi:phosphocarrier protein HPr